MLYYSFLFVVAVTAYIRLFQPDVTYDNTLLVYASEIGLQGLCMLFSGYVERKIGPRKCSMLGAAIAVLAIFLASFSKSLEFLVLTNGVLFGIGIGFAYIPPISASISWLPEHKGLVTGIIVAGFGGGAFVFGEIATAIVNPDQENVSPLTDYFPPDSAVPHRVPTMYLSLSCMYFVMMAVGCYLITDPVSPLSSMYVGEAGDVSMSALYLTNERNVPSHSSQPYDLSSNATADSPAHRSHLHSILRSTSSGSVDSSKSKQRSRGASMGGLYNRMIHEISSREYIPLQGDQGGGSDQDEVNNHKDGVQMMSLAKHQGVKQQEEVSVVFREEPNALYGLHPAHKLEEDLDLGLACGTDSRDKDLTNSLHTTTEFSFSSVELLSFPLFYHLCLCFMLTSGGGMYLLGTYKTFGESLFPHSEEFLSLVAAFASVFNAVGRIFWGATADKIGNINALKFLAFFYSIVIGMFYFMATLGGKCGFTVSVFMLFFFGSGNFALYLPSTIELFGSKYASGNYGLVFFAYSSCVFANILWISLKQSTSSDEAPLTAEEQASSQKELFAWTIAVISLLTFVGFLAVSALKYHFNHFRTQHHT